MKDPNERTNEREEGKHIQSATSTARLFVICISTAGRQPVAQIVGEFGAAICAFFSVMFGRHLFCLPCWNTPVWTFIWARNEIGKQKTGTYSRFILASLGTFLPFRIFLFFVFFRLKVAPHCSNTDLFRSLVAQSAKWVIRRLTGRLDLIQSSLNSRANFFNSSFSSPNWQKNIDAFALFIIKTIRKID